MNIRLACILYVTLFLMCLIYVLKITKCDIKTNVPVWFTDETDFPSDFNHVCLFWGLVPELLPNHTRITTLTKSISATLISERHNTQ